LSHTEEKPHLIIDALGESKQSIGVRIENTLLAEIHKQVTVEKELASSQDWPTKTMTDVIEILLRKGLRARRAELAAQKVAGDVRQRKTP
jgi:hypothetical protein